MDQVGLYYIQGMKRFPILKDIFKLQNVWEENQRGKISQ